VNLFELAKRKLWKPKFFFNCTVPEFAVKNFYWPSK